MSAILSVTRLKTARRCLREHRYRYIDGYEAARKSDDLRFGTLFHAALEAWWLGKMHGDADPLDRALTVLDADSDADGFEKAKALVLMVGYDARWSEQPYQVLGVEVEFAGEFVNPETGQASKTWRRGGRIDTLVREFEHGRKLVVEHKTSSEDIRQGSDYWRRLRIDPQITTYFEGARLAGFDVEGCLYDVVKKPGEKPKKATPVEARKYTKPTKNEPARLYAGQRDTDESVEEYRGRLTESVLSDPLSYFQRGEVARLGRDLHEGLLDDWYFGQTLRDLVRLGRAPRNPDACQRYGRLCEFFDVCTGVASLDDPTRFRRLHTVNPELSEGERAESPKGAA